MTLRTERLAYDADGLKMAGHYCFDDSVSGPRPGVLVFPEAFGIGEHVKTRAERLATLGYAALACDLHGEGRLVGSLDEVMKILGPLMQNPDSTRARARGALDALVMRGEVDASRIAATGYCFGGTMALEL